MPHKQVVFSVKKKKKKKMLAGLFSEGTYVLFSLKTKKKTQVDLQKGTVY